MSLNDHYEDGQGEQLPAGRMHTCRELGAYLMKTLRLHELRLDRRTVRLVQLQLVSPLKSLVYWKETLRLGVHRSASAVLILKNAIAIFYPVCHSDDRGTVVAVTYQVTLSNCAVPL